MNPAHEALLALVCGLPARERRTRLIMALTAYIDDSGSQPKEQVFVLAGFVSTVERWLHFTDAWDAACAKEPPTPDFHMAQADFLKGYRSYWGWGTEDELRARRDGRVNELVSIIKDHVICRISAGMDWEVYEAHAKGRVPKELDSPYFFLFWNLMMSMARAQKAVGAREKVSFVFDVQGDLGPRAALWHHYVLHTIEEDARYILGASPTFDHDNIVRPLKAADMLAWHMRRDVADKVAADRGGAPYVRRPALSTMLEIDSVTGNVPRPVLLKILAAMDAYAPPG